MNLEFDKRRAKQVAEALLDAYRTQGVFGQTAEHMPELAKPKGLIRGSKNHVNYFTLVTALDYMRNAEQLWKAGVETFEDPKTRWVFDLDSPRTDNLEELVKGLQVHKLSKKYNLDAKYWQTISRSIKDIFDGDMKGFLVDGCGLDASIIYNTMKGYRKEFPCLTGDKILPLWIRMLKDSCKLNIKNIESIPLAVDVHVARATFYTGCLKGEGFQSEIKNTAKLIDSLWSEAAIENGFSKFDLDEPLWNLSKYGCNKRRDMACKMQAECPVEGYCEAVKRPMQVSQEKYGVYLP